MLLPVRQRGRPREAHIPGSLLGTNAQSEDIASTGVSNPGRKQDSSALRQACLAPLRTGDPEESGRRLRSHDLNHDVCSVQGGLGASKVAVRTK